MFLPFSGDKYEAKRKLTKTKTNKLQYVMQELKFILYSLLSLINKIN